MISRRVRSLVFVSSIVASSGQVEIYLTGSGYLGYSLGLAWGFLVPSVVTRLDQRFPGASVFPLLCFPISFLFINIRQSASRSSDLDGTRIFARLQIIPPRESRAASINVAHQGMSSAEKSSIIYPPSSPGARVEIVNRRVHDFQLRRS